MKVNFDLGTMTAFDITIEMKHKSFYTNPFSALSNILDDIEDDHDNCLTSTQILESKYDKADIHKVVAQQTHLNTKQPSNLQDIFSKRTKLFSGKLGHYTAKNMHLELLPGTQPKHAKPYHVPRHLLEVFQTELERLVKIGILSHVGGAEWASPTFILPKKDLRVRWVSNFRELNKVIRQNIYPLPLIPDILNKPLGYKYFTKIDMSMQYYTFELLDAAKELCVIKTPFGKSRYK
jgi:hypothetical protein